ncbi:MAG: tRNA (adenosine(37)-N6)-threonylcarbamoyltransferase complex ATPase subunit type 1 TsaE [Pseudanabaena sp.]
MTETLKIDLYAKNLAATQAIATQLAQLVTTGTIILLEGNLGSGKTTFMQAFGRALGISTTIASPTFTLIDEYTEGRLPLYHIDLYRLDPSQVPSLHLEEYWRGEDFPLGVVAIEWASKLLTIPPQHLKINLSMPASTFYDQEQKHQVQTDALAEDFVDDLPSDRLIQLIAKGRTYVELLKSLPNTRVLL